MTLHCLSLFAHDYVDALKGEGMKAPGKRIPIGLQLTDRPWQFQSPRSYDLSNCAEESGDLVGEYNGLLRKFFGCTQDVTGSAAGLTGGLRDAGNAGRNLGRAGSGLFHRVGDLAGRCVLLFNRRSDA